MHSVVVYAIVQFPSVTFIYCIEMSKHILTLYSPSAGPPIQVSMQEGYEKIVIFDHLALSRL